MINNKWISKPKHGGDYWLSPFIEGEYVKPRIVGVINFGVALEVKDGNQMVKLPLYLEEYYPGARWMFIPIPDYQSLNKPIPQ